MRPRYITATRLHIVRTTARSWRDEDVGEVEGLAAGSRNSFSTVACTDTSRPEVGSSRMTSLGLQRQDARQPDAALLAAAKSRADRDRDARRAARPRPGSRAPARSRSARVSVGVDHQRLVQRAADLPARIERGARVLVDVLQAAGARRAARAGARPSISLPSNRISPARRLVDAHDRLAERGLAAAALADEPERLARPHVERDAVDAP